MDNSITIGDFSDSSLRHRSFSTNDQNRGQRRRNSHQVDQQQQGSSSTIPLNSGSDTSIHYGSFTGSRASMESGSAYPTETASAMSELVCKACGFEASFVPEGMLNCDQCEAAHYCSQHCKDWDWNSGGHRRQCGGASQRGAPPRRESTASQASLRSSSSIEGDKTEVSIEMGELFDKPSRMAMMMRAARRAGPGGRPTLATARAPMGSSPGRGGASPARRSSLNSLQSPKDFRKDKPESTTARDATAKTSSARGSPSSAMRAPDGQLGAFLNKKTPDVRKDLTPMNGNHSSGGSAPFTTIKNDDSSEDKSNGSTTGHPSFASDDNHDRDDDSISFSAFHMPTDLYAALPCITEENSKMMSSIMLSASWRHNSQQRQSSKLQASFASATSRLVMEDSAIINGESNHSFNDGSSPTSRRNNISPKNGDPTGLSPRRRQDSNDKANGVELKSRGGGSQVGKFAQGSMMVHGNKSISSMNGNVDEHECPNLRDLVVRDATVGEENSDHRGGGSSDKQNSHDQQHDIHEDSVLLELDYSDVSSRDESSQPESIPLGTLEGSIPTLEPSVKVAYEEEGDREKNSEETESSADVYEESDKNGRYSAPASPSRASSLKSFREAYNGDSSGTTSPGRDSESSADCHSLKDFREIYEAEKDDQGSALSHYSGGSASTGRGSTQLQEHLAQLLSKTLDTGSIPSVLDEADEQDDVSLLSSTSPKQWKPQMDKMALGRPSSHALGSGGLYSAAKIESSESESVDENRVVAPSRKSAERRSSMSSLRSFREAYNSDASDSSCHSMEQTGSSGSVAGTVKSSTLKDFRDIYEAEKDDPSVFSCYSDDTNSTGKGSVQLKEQLSKLLNSTKAAVPANVEEADNDDVSLLTEALSPKQPIKNRLEGLPVNSRSGSRNRGSSLYSTKQSNESISSSENSARDIKKSGSMSSLKKFRDAYNSDSSSSKSLEPTSESSGSVTPNSTNSLKDFRGIYEAGKDEPSIFSYHSDGTNSTGKGSTQLREQLSQLLSTSSQSSQCSAVPLAVDSNADDVMSMLTASPQRKDHRNGKSTSRSTKSGETDSMAVSRSLLAAKERNESMKESLNNALRVYEEMYGEAAAEDVFRKLTSGIDLPLAKQSDHQASGEETFDWKRSFPKPESLQAADCHPAPGNEPPLTKVEESTSRFSKYRTGLLEANEVGTADENVSANMEEAQECKASHYRSGPTASTVEPSHSFEKPRYMAYRASLTRNGAEPVPESPIGSSQSDDPCSGSAEGNDELEWDEKDSARSKNASDCPGLRTQPGYLRYRAKLLTQNERPKNNDSGGCDRVIVETRTEDISTVPRYMHYRKTLSNAKVATDLMKDTTEGEASESMNESRHSQSSRRSVSFKEDMDPLKETKGFSTVPILTPGKESELSCLAHPSKAVSKATFDNFGNPEIDDSASKANEMEIENSAALSDSNQRYAQYRKRLLVTKLDSQGSEKSDDTFQSGTSCVSAGVCVEKSQKQSTFIPNTLLSHDRQSLSGSKTSPFSHKHGISSGNSQIIESDRENATAESDNELSGHLPKPRYAQYRNLLAEPSRDDDDSQTSGNISKGDDSASSKVTNANQEDEQFCALAKPRHDEKSTLKKTNNLTEAAGQSVSSPGGSSTQEDLAVRNIIPHCSQYRNFITEPDTAAVNGHRSEVLGGSKPISLSDTIIEIQTARVTTSLVDSGLVCESQYRCSSLPELDAHSPDEQSNGEFSLHYTQYHSNLSQPKKLIDERIQEDSGKQVCRSELQYNKCIASSTAPTNAGECKIGSESEQNMKRSLSTPEPRYAKYKSSLESAGHVVDESENISASDSELTSSARSSPDAQQTDENSPSPFYARYRASLSARRDPDLASKSSANSFSSSSTSSIKSTNSAASRSSEGGVSAAKSKIDAPPQAKAWVISSSTQDVDDSDSSSSALQLRYMQYPTLKQTKTEGDDSPSSTDWGNASLSCILDKDAAVGHETNTLRRYSEPLSSDSKPAKPKGYKALTMTIEPKSKKIDPIISLPETGKIMARSVATEMAEDPPVERLAGSAASISLDPMELWDEGKYDPSYSSPKRSPKRIEKSKSTPGRSTQFSNASDASTAKERIKRTTEKGERIPGITQNSRRKSNATSASVSSWDDEKVKLVPDPQGNARMTLAHTMSKKSDDHMAFDPLQLPTGEDRTTKIDSFVDIECGIQSFDHFDEEENNVQPKKSRSKAMYFFLAGLLVILAMAIGFGIAYRPSRTDDDSNKDGSGTLDQQNSSTDPPNPVSTMPPNASTPAPSNDSLAEAPPTRGEKLMSLLIAKGSGISKEKIETKGTPQNISYEWLLSDPELFSKFTADKIIRRYALATLYYSMDGSNWVNNAGWVTDADECEWYTMQPSCFGDVLLSLNLSFNGLSGTIPNDVALLTDLREVALTGTSGSLRTIGGTLPEELGRIKELRVLDVQGNSIVGRIPSKLGELSHLEVLNLSMNKLTDSIPSELKALTLLRRLNLAMNEITGEIPSGINELLKLEELHLGNNNLKGSIGLFGLPLLHTLNLEKNRFISWGSGIGSLLSLEYLTVYENYLVGNLPTEIAQLSNLKKLNLHTNSIVGPIPSEIGHLPNLVDLDLSRNNFSGSIPVEIGYLGNLASLQLQSNHLSGSVPTSFSQLFKAELIRIDKNDITGEVPVTVCVLFNTFVPTFYLDCSADRFGGPEITCPNEFCCTYCCDDDSPEC